MNQQEKITRPPPKSDEHYRALWDYAVDSEFILDAGGMVRDVNRRAELKLGRAADDLIGHAAADLFPPADRDRFDALLQQVLNTWKEAAGGQMQVAGAGGGMLTMEVDIVPVEKADGATAVLLQLSDVTDRQQLERQLLRSERLASLSQFASMFAHDIRNPLAGIKKTLELLGHRPELQSEAVHRWFCDLQLTTDLLLGMINDMLDVYQESYSGLPLICSSFPARMLLEGAAHLFTAEAEARHVTFHMDWPDADVILAGDRRRLQRVGINLVHNALKYSPPGGAITLSVRRLASEVPSTGRHVTQDVLLFRVEDEGPGVEPDELPSIFDMFFRKKDGHDLRIGRGLGLHFCRLVIEAHGGRVWAENRPMGGARFSVALPLNVEDPCRSAS